MSQPISVIFIQSRGHSGSTLLELLLGAHSQILPVGELKMLFPKQQLIRSRANKVQTCCCAAIDIFDCAFWSKIDSVLMQKHGYGLVDLDLLSNDTDIFYQHNLALFQVLAEVSGKNIIVDSSKRLKRLLGLTNIRELQIYPIHLQRMPLGSVYSQSKKGDPCLTAAYRYTKTVIHTYRTLKDINHYPLSYEDLVRYPDATLRQLMIWLDLNFEAGQLLWSGQPHHRIGGNERVRKLNDHAIIEDQQWRSQLSFWQKLSISGLTLPVRFPNSTLWELERHLLGRWLGT